MVGASALGDPRRRLGKQLADALPDLERVRRREMAHVRAGLVAPDPHAVDARRAGSADRAFEVGEVGGCEAECRDPELRGDTVAIRRLDQQACEPLHEGAGLLVEALPVRIRREDVDAGERGDRVPVAHAVRALDRGKQADRVASAARANVLCELAEKVDERRLAKGEHLVVELRRKVAAEPLSAHIARAAPASGVVDADVVGDDPVRLVPEDEVGSGFERCVGPFGAERAVGRMVETGCGDAAAVVEHLARIRVHRHEPALRLAAERPPEAPGVHLHLEPSRVRCVDDALHRVPVVREVVLGVRVQHAGEPAAHEIVEVALDVTRDAHAEVRAAGLAASGRGRHRAPSAPERPCAASAASAR